jgi:DNA-binding YbaB/EbfC family protein
MRELKIELHLRVLISGFISSFSPKFFVGWLEIIKEQAMAKVKKPERSGKGMLAQIQRLQQELQQAQAELAEEFVEVSIGGGAVKIQMTGTQECKTVEIDPHLLEEGDVEMLQDLLILAINQAIGDSQILAAGKLGPMTGGLGIPGLGWWGLFQGQLSGLLRLLLVFRA